MLSPRAVALQGVGFAPRVLALQGWAETEVVERPAGPRDLDVHVLSPIFEAAPLSAEWRRLIENWRDEYHLGTGLVRVSGGAQARFKLAITLPQPQPAKPPRPKPARRIARTAASAGALRVGLASHVAVERSEFDAATALAPRFIGASAGQIEFYLPLLRMSLGRFSVRGLAHAEAVPDLAPVIAKRNARTLDALTRAGVL